MSKIFPNESPDYRVARDELLNAEAALRAQIEAVAAQRRALPLGGLVPENYAFEERLDGSNRTTRLADLFTPQKPVLFIYNFMYGPQMKAPCPSCTSVLDALNATALHAEQRMNLAVVAASPIERIRTFADARGWHHLRLLSSAQNRFNRDYHAETENGGQMPMGHVFEKTDGGIHHRWSTELLYRSWPDGEPRHVDAIWPLWNLFDLTPIGRGQTWHPAVRYAD